MKRSALFVALIVISVGAALAQGKTKHIEIGTGYNAAVPKGSMQQHANTVHGANIQAIYLLPKSNGRLGMGLELNAGSYASFTKNHVFGFNGTSTPTDVKYNSNVTSGGVIVRYSMIQNNNYNVFAAARGGLANFTSKLEVEDPKDPDGCHPLETRNLIEDNTWQAGARLGGSMDVHAIFRRFPSNLLLVQGYGGYVIGGDVNYINVKNTTEDNASHNHTTTTSSDGTALNMQFVNVGTGETHEHEVARVYNSPLRFLEAGVSLIVRF